MTLSIDDLRKLHSDYILANLEQGNGNAVSLDAMRAVVTALRDEMLPPEYTHLTDAEKGWLQFFNEILASRGDEAAGSVAQVVEPLEVREVTGASPVRPAAAPAADVCEWTRSKRPGSYIPRCQKGEIFRNPYEHCPACGLPVAFVEAAR